ncbi:hypothetical protein [Actinoplanes sp. NPDC051851]|uniref:hypothetical protein n=1 Tax=Actinoplanes sp. NPDC051851 TaxID=3154753 RepID=UPI00341E79B6
MEVVDVVVLTILAVGLVMAIGYAVWPIRDRSEEGLLLRRLLCAEISRSEYRHAVASLAAREEQFSPLTVPGDRGA